MFGFAQWDSPLALVLEALISIALVVALLIVAQRVNARAAADRERHMQTRSSAPPTENTLTARELAPEDSDTERSEH